MAEHIIVPKPQDCITKLSEPRVPLGIQFNFIFVLTAIQLDGDHFSQRNEIDNISSDGMLSSKLNPINLTRS